MKQLNKSYFEALVKIGKNVDEMATQMSSDFEFKVSANDVRKASKEFNINLRSKPRNKFVYVDDSSSVKTNVTSDVELGEGVFNMQKSVVLE